LGVGVWGLRAPPHPPTPKPPIPNPQSPTSKHLLIFQNLYNK